MSKSKATRAAIKSLNWAKLRVQRETMRRIASSDIKLADDLYGIVHLLDSIHEAAEADDIGKARERAKYKEGA